MTSFDPTTIINFSDTVYDTIHNFCYMSYGLGEGKFVKNKEKTKQDYE